MVESRFQDQLMKTSRTSSEVTLMIVFFSVKPVEFLMLLKN